MQLKIILLCSERIKLQFFNVLWDDLLKGIHHYEDGYRQNNSEEYLQPCAGIFGARIQSATVESALLLRDKCGKPDVHKFFFAYSFHTLMITPFSPGLAGKRICANSCKEVNELKFEF